MHVYVCVLWVLCRLSQIIMISCPSFTTKTINFTDDFEVPLFILLIYIHINKLAIFSMINFILLSIFKWVVIVSVQNYCALQLFTLFFLLLRFFNFRADRDFYNSSDVALVTRFLTFYWNRLSCRSILYK